MTTAKTTAPLAELTSSDLRARGWILCPNREETYWIHWRDFGARRTSDLVHPVYIAKGAGPIRLAMQHSPAAQRMVAYLAEMSRANWAATREAWT